MPPATSKFGQNQSLKARERESELGRTNLRPQTDIRRRETDRDREFEIEGSIIDIRRDTILHRMGSSEEVAAVRSSDASGV